MSSTVFRVNTLFNAPYSDGHKDDEARYNWQVAVRGNYMLLGDKAITIPVVLLMSNNPVIESRLQWINRGELISGSAMGGIAHGYSGNPADVDIYFKSKQDVDDFMVLNKMDASVKKVSNSIGTIVYLDKQLNLIHGIPYKDPADLISYFDIRACSIAWDPHTNLVHAVQGALSDCAHMKLVYNPVPHNTTVWRLIKYTRKGFEIDPYQRLFLVELLKDSRYNPELEISTGYRGIPR